MQSEKIDLLSAALVAAQSEVTNAAKTATNPHFRSRYADLASVREAIVAPLAKHGLVVSQTFVPRVEPLICEHAETRGGQEIRYPVQSLGSLRTLLMHSSGQWLASELPILCPWGDPQKLGSAISYYRRYALAAIAGIAQEDDDGTSASGRPAAAQSQRPAPRQTPAQQPAVRPQQPAPVQPQPATPREPGEDPVELLPFHELDPCPRNLWGWCLDNGYREDIEKIGRDHKFPDKCIHWNDHQRDVAWAILNGAELPPNPEPAGATNGEARRGGWGGGR